MGVRAAVILVALAGCAAQTPPPDSPTAVQIATAAAEIGAAGLKPSDYASVGITLSQHACAQWFTQQVMNSQSTGFGQSALSIGAGIAAAAGGPAGAGAAAGASALSALLGAAQASFGAGASPAAIWGLISRMQAAWLAAMPIPLTTADAYALVEAFAEQCSLPAIEGAVMAAMAAVPVTAAVARPATEGSPALPQALSPTAPRKQRSPSRPAASREAASPETSSPRDCYMSVMGCRVAIPRVCIGSC
jgi:hypothetical protein